MYVRLFFKENTTGSVRCGRGERKDTVFYNRITALTSAFSDAF